MTIKTGQEELDQYTLTRSEYAKELGKTPNAVRMMMRHGKLSGQYRYDGSKYIFKAPERPGENHNNDHPVITKMTTKKIKKINRGNHFKADYPNEAFKLHNQYKKEQAILNKIQGKFKNEAHELEYKKLNDEALKKSLENTEKKNKESFTPLKDYGGPVAMRRSSYPIDREDYMPPSRS
jgi:predicted transcriptional regulator